MKKIIVKNDNEFSVEDTIVTNLPYTLQGLLNERQICVDKIAELNAKIAEIDNLIDLFNEEKNK